MPINISSNEMSKAAAVSDGSQINNSDRNERLQDLTNRILKLEIDDAKSGSGHEEEIMAALIAAVAGLIAAWVGGRMAILSQRIMADRERKEGVKAARRELVLARETAKQQLELARKQSVFDQTEKILEFRIKQLEYFYAPVFALLQQSAALYEKMFDQLVEDDPNQYKRNNSEKSNRDKFVLGKDNTWKPFRLLDQLPAIRKNAKAFELVTKIVEIGQNTTKIISEHAGLASSDMIDSLSGYLAHFALLSAVYNGNENEAKESMSQKTGYFSDDLNKKVAAGYRELSEFLDLYVNASKKSLKELPEIKEQP